MPPTKTPLHIWTSRVRRESRCPNLSRPSLLVPENVKAFIRKSVSNATYTLAILARIGEKDI